MYEFFMASLPVILPGEISSLTLEDFDNRVRQELPQVVDKLLDFTSSAPMYAKIRRFESYLNWRIGRIRGDRLGKLAEFTEPEEFFGDVDHYLPLAAAADPLKRELLLDDILWRYLDDLEVNHIFDFDQLCIYRRRLALTQKYAERNKEAGKKSFYKLLETYKSTMEQQI